MKAPHVCSFSPSAQGQGKSWAFLLAALLALLPAHVRADLDSDGDGLSDIDESSLHHTNPQLADTDGDSLPDGLEIQMGTDPLNAASGLRITSQTPLPDGRFGQRICWNTVAGHTYELQRMCDPGLNLWGAVAQVIASSSTTCYDAFERPGSSCFYRVRYVADAVLDRLQPLVSKVIANLLDDAALAARLSVTARDLVGVQRVEFMDGPTVIGVGRPGPNHTYSFDWPSASSGRGLRHLRARAIDAAGNVGYSAVLAFEIPRALQSTLTVGNIRLAADVIETIGSERRMSGYIHLNGIPLTVGSTVTVAGSRIIGQGGIILPGLGTAFDGAFEVNTVTGLLTARVGTTPALPDFGFNSRLFFASSQISINLLDGSFCGSGPLTLSIPGHAFGPATFNGTVCYLPLAGTVTTDGTLTMGPFTAKGQSVVQLHDSTFRFSGDARLNTSNGDTYAMDDAVARLTYAGPRPNLSVSGRLAFPDGLALQVSGNANSTGEISLNGSGSGVIGGVMFSSIQGTLTRPAGANTLTSLNFRGQLSHPNLSHYILTGTIRSNGSIDLQGTGRATFSGITIDPLTVRATGNVLNGTPVFALNGTLAVSYLEPVTFSGTLRADGSLELNGQSGPYTALSFDEDVPPMNDPTLTFEEKIFVGSYHLFARNPTLSTTVFFRLSREPNSAGGNATLTANADVAVTGLPTLRLIGIASTTGAWSVSGAMAGQRTSLWGFNVDNLSVRVSRATTGLISYSVTGGTFAYSGLVLSAAGTQLSGSVLSDGSGSLSCTHNATMFTGFNLQSATLQLSWNAAGTATLTLNASRMVLPGFGSATVAVSGALSTSGTFSLSGRTAGALSLSPLPVTSLAANAVVTLTRNGLTLSGSVSGGVLGHVGLTSANALLSVSAAGAITLSGSIFCPPLTAGVISVLPVSGANLNCTLNNNGLSFSGARVQVSGIFSAAITLPAFTMEPDGDFSVIVPAGSPSGFSIAGYPVANLSFTLRRSTGVLSLNSVQARLNVGSFTQTLNGSITSGGVVTMDWSGSFTLGGFLASNGELHLRRTAAGVVSLGAEGTFDLDAAEVDFGNLSATGNVSTAGSFSLTGTTALTIDGIVTSSADLTMDATGIRASASVGMNYGTLRMSLTNLRISTAGISFSACASMDSPWVRFIDVLVVDQGDTYGRFDGTMCLSVAANGNITARVSGTLAAWVYSDRPPAGINETPFRTSISASIGTGGNVCFSHSFAGINWADWCFDLW